MKKNEKVSNLHAELEEITRAIRTKKILLEQAKKICHALSQKSNFGWMVSMFIDELGIPLAVRSAADRRRWDELIRKMEQEIILLMVDRRFKEKEIELVCKYKF
jgi:hypothetical protein